MNNVFQEYMYEYNKKYQAIEWLTSSCERYQMQANRDKTIYLTMIQLWQDLHMRFIGQDDYLRRIREAGL